MEILKTITWVIYMITSLVIIVLVLLQQGKGADAGATFGGGGSSSGSFFGAAGSSNFMSRSTAIAAFIFFSTCLALNFLFSHEDKSVLGVIGQTSAIKTTPQAQQKPLVVPLRKSNNSSANNSASKNKKSGSTQIPE